MHMENKTRFDEICELLKIWHSLKDMNWPAAKNALESKINLLCEDLRPTSKV